MSVYQLRVLAYAFIYCLYIPIVITLRASVDNDKKLYMELYARGGLEQLSKRISPSSIPGKMEAL